MANSYPNIQRNWGNELCCWPTFQGRPLPNRKKVTASASKRATLRIGKGGNGSGPLGETSPPGPRRTGHRSSRRRGLPARPRQPVTGRSAFWTW